MTILARQRPRILEGNRLGEDRRAELFAQAGEDRGLGFFQDLEHGFDVLGSADLVFDRGQDLGHPGASPALARRGLGQEGWTTDGGRRSADGGAIFGTCSDMLQRYGG